MTLRRLLCGLCLLLTQGFATPAQSPPYLTIIDPMNLDKVVGAEVRIFAHDRPKAPISQGRSDQQGQVALPTHLPDSGYVIVAHPSYEGQRLSLQELAGQQYHLYLDLRSYDAEDVLFSAGRFRSLGEQVPHHVDVITAKEVAFRNPQTMAELLSQDGGVFVQKSQLGGGSPNLRGFEANKVLLVIDGVRMNNAIYRSGHIQNVITLDPAILDRTEVLFGPGAVIYGSDALGGVMHMSTRDPHLHQGSGQKWSGHASMRVGSVNREKTAHFDLNLGSRRWAALTSISVSDFGDLRSGRWRPAYPTWGRRDSLIISVNGEDQIVANEAPHIQAPTGYQQVHLLQKLLFLPTTQHSHLLNVQLSTSSDIPRYDRLTQLRDGQLRFAEWAYGPQTRLLASYRFRHHPEGRWYDQLTILPAYQYIEESRYDRLFQADTRDVQIERLHIGSINVDAQKQLRPDHQLQVGVEGLMNQVASQAFSHQLETGVRLPTQPRYPGGGTLYLSASAYLTHHWQIRPTLTWQAGARLTGVSTRAQLDDTSVIPLPFDEIVQRNLAPSANLGLSWRPTPDWRVRGLLGTGFRAPNLDDLGKVFDSQPGNVIVPNPHLVPEYTYQAELGLRYRWSTWLTAQVDGYYTLYDRAIVVRDFPAYGIDSLLYDGVLSNVQANVNARQAWLAGGSAALEGRIANWHARAQVNYTYGYIPDEQTLLDHIPPLFGLLRLSYASPVWALTATAQFQGWKRLTRNQTAPPFHDSRDLSNQAFATEDGWPAWWVFDLKGEYALHKAVTLQAGVENMLDLHYRPYASRMSAPGRNVYVAVRGKL